MAKPNVRIEGCSGVGVHHSILDLPLMLEHVNVVHPTAGYDFAITFTVPGPHPRKKTICPYMEPPIGPGYYEPYRDAAQFHTVYTFFPRNGQFEITTDAIVFPYPPNTSWDVPRKREMTSGVIYYAGNRAAPEQFELDKHGRYNFYALRTQIVETMMHWELPVVAYGPGWPLGSTRTRGDFQMNKFGEMDACDADFVLCLENSCMQNYISEKIHNGFQSGRVVCYLGEPLIHERVPEEAFINLNDLVDPETKVFDHETMYLLLHNMSSSEYSRITEAAAEWRHSGLEERRDHQSTALTTHILKRMGCL